MGAFGLVYSAVSPLLWFRIGLTEILGSWVAVAQKVPSFLLGYIGIIQDMALFYG